jgi:FkbM family methyltransferase
LLAYSSIDSRFAQSAIDALNLSLGKGAGSDSLNLEVTLTLKQFKPQHLAKLKVLDIGANIGDYSVEMLNQCPSAVIYCFEPSLETFEILRDRLESNENIKLEQLAISEFEGRALLYSNPEISGLSSLTRRRLDHFGMSMNESQDIELVTLDSWTKLNSVVPDIIKIDVEGHELAVLKGAQKTILKVKIIQFEFGGCNIDTNTYFQDFWYFFQEFKFDIYRISPRGLIKIPEYNENDEFFKTTNYLAINSLFT